MRGILFQLILVISFGLLSVNTLAQKIYVAGNGSGIILRYDLDGSNQEPMGTGGFASGIQDIIIDPVTNRGFWTSGTLIMQADIVTTSTGVTFTNVGTFLDVGVSTDPVELEIDFVNREIFVVEHANNAILKADIDAATPSISPVLTDSFIEGLALDPINGKLYYIRNITSNEVMQANLDGSSQTTVINGSTIGFPNLREVAVDNVNGQLYFNGDFSGEGQIWISDFDGNNAAMIIGSLESPRGMTVDGSGGNIYYADSGVSGNIGKADLDGSNNTNIETGLDFPVSVALDLSSAIPPKVYWTEGEVDFNQGEIHRTNLDGSDFERYYDGFSTRLSGVDIDEANNFIYFSDGANAEIKRAQVGETGFIDDLYELIVDFNPSQDDSLEQVVWNANNNLLYYTYSGIDEVQHVDPNAPTPMTTVTTVANVPNPVGIDVDLVNNKIYFTGNNLLAASNTATLYRSDFDGSNLEVLYEVTTTSPQELFFDVKVDPSNDMIYWSAGPYQMAGKIYSNDINEPPPFSAPSSFSLSGEPRGIDLDFINNKIYWVCRGTLSLPPMIMRADLNGSNIENIHSITQIVLTPNPGFLAIHGPPCTSPATANAGPDLSICSGATASLSGSIGGSASSGTWTTSGDGTFDNPNNLNAVYTPGSNDITNGTVTLTLITNDPSGSCTASCNDMTLTIAENMTVDAGADQQICVGAQVNLSGTVTGDISSTNWDTDGDGSFDNTGSLTAVYTPGSTDEASGTVTLTLTAASSGACADVASNITIDILPNPTASDLSEDASIGQPLNIDIEAANEATNNQSFTVSIIDPQPTKGTISFSQGVAIYTANEGTLGADQINYEISDMCGTDTGIVDITILNDPPAIDPPSGTIEQGVPVTISLANAFSDLNGNLDLSTLQIVSGPLSGAPATLDASNLTLTINYTSVNFSGQDEITIRVCDDQGACSEAVILIEVLPQSIVIYNAVSPNNDDFNDYWRIENLLPPNKIELYNRWGDLVKTLNDYNGEEPNNLLNDLPAGTYFYKIVSSDGQFNGYLTLKK